jgi:hypothetical protein
MRRLCGVKRDDNKQVNVEVSEEQSGLPYYPATEAGSCAFRRIERQDVFINIRRVNLEGN